MEGKQIINWFPGHMAKARRLLGDQLGRVDAVIELCDARLPLSSRNPDLDSLVQQKPRLLLLSKADLADPEETAAWLSWYQGQGITALATTQGKQKQHILKSLAGLTAARSLRIRQRGLPKPIRVMVLGVPNVGKSTLINYLAGRAAFKVADKPGVTRAPQWINISAGLQLLDSPGLLWPRLDDATAAHRLAYIAAVRDEVLDIYRLAISLVDELIQLWPAAMQARYKLDDTSLRGQALLEKICKKRGFLLRGGQADLERGAVCVLDEFRDGTIGRITLEKPPGSRHENS